MHSQEVATDTLVPDIARYLESGCLCPTLSEAHGMLCGLICAGEPKAVDVWLDQIIPAGDNNPPSPDTGRVVLCEWAAGISAHFQAPERVLDLPSPDDSAPLRERALWLYDWTRGFLYGLGLHSLGIADCSAQGREIIADLTAITQMDLGQLDDSEDNEQALAELIEFVRVAVMLLHAEQTSAKQTAPTPIASS
ncbi:UPF0149 family protein [Caldichromatium japonicum]|uniref:UPF0149 family protein n=1 Tax=Caldichromatium japonicum TaxID=2699430 RepID=UPI001FEAF800|nr:UPF0149 family protein [Caldichromatium japonicum]